MAYSSDFKFPEYFLSIKAWDNWIYERLGYLPEHYIDENNANEDIDYVEHPIDMFARVDTGLENSMINSKATPGDFVKHPNVSVESFKKKILTQLGTFRGVSADLREHILNNYMVKEYLQSLEKWRAYFNPDTFTEEDQERVNGEIKFLVDLRVGLIDERFPDIVKSDMKRKDTNIYIKKWQDLNLMPKIGGRYLLWKHVKVKGKIEEGEFRGAGGAPYKSGENFYYSDSQAGAGPIGPIKEYMIDGSAYVLAMLADEDTLQAVPEHHFSFGVFYARSGKVAAVYRVTQDPMDDQIFDFRRVSGEKMLVYIGLYEEGQKFG